VLDRARRHVAREVEAAVIPGKAGKDYELALGVLATSQEQDESIAGACGFRNGSSSACFSCPVTGWGTAPTTSSSQTEPGRSSRKRAIVVGLLLTASALTKQSTVPLAAWVVLFALLRHRGQATVLLLVAVGSFGVALAALQWASHRPITRFAVVLIATAYYWIRRILAVDI
jgi:hypothetical protein